MLRLGRPDEILRSGRSKLGKRHRRQILGRHGADEALIARAHVVQIRRLDQQVRFRQGKAARGLLEIDAATDAGLHFLLDLFEHRAVPDVVLLGQGNQLAIAKDVEIGARGIEGGGFRSVEEIEIAHLPSVIEPLDLVPRREAVIEQLRQGQARRSTVEVPLNQRVVAVLAARAGAEIHARQVATRGDLLLVGGRLIGVPFLHDFRIALDRLLRRRLERILLRTYTSRTQENHAEPGCQYRSSCAEKKHLNLPIPCH